MHSLKKFKALLYNFPQKAFTLTEVIIATVIFALAAAGLLAVVSTMTRPAAVSSREMRATLIAKGILDGLRPFVDAATWDKANLAVNPNPYRLPDVIYDNTIYRISYLVSNETTTGGRLVSVNVTWDE